MGLEPGARQDAVVVVDQQQPEVGVVGAVVGAEREAVLGVEPADVGGEAVVGPADVAVGIRGRARVLKEQLDCWPGDAAITIEVSTVKNDALPMAPVESGITYSVPADVGARIQQYFDELESAPPAG